MKNYLIATLLIMPFLAQSQNYWKLGGNNAFPPSPVNAGNNILGTLIDLPIRIETNGTQRMYIANGGATNGFVGIGSNFSTPASLLHVNGTNNNTGNLFETTGPLGLDNIWEMNVTNALATRFIIRIPANQFHTQFETNNNGQFNFFTNTSASGNARSVSIQGGVGNVVHGQVAFGNALPINFDAQSRLHLHKTTTLNQPTGGNFIQFTSTNTLGGDNPTTQSGLQVGQPSVGNDAYIRQWEDAHMRFFTNGTQRVHINELPGVNATDGFVGINTVGPTARLDINGDLRIRNVLEEVPHALFVGVQHTPGIEQDLDVRRLDFNGQTNFYLAGNGAWQQLPPPIVVDAHNGTSMSTLLADHVALGQNVNEPGNPGELLNNREIPLNGFNIYFNGNPTVPGNTNRIIVGQDGGLGWQGKFHVNALANNFSRSAVTGMIDGSNLDLTSGLFGVSRNGLNTSYGVRAEAHDGTLQSVGVLSLANGASNNIAYQGVIQYAGTGPIGGANHTGLSLRVEDAVNTNTGIQVDVFGYGATGNSYGIRNQVIGGTQNVFGIWTNGQGNPFLGQAQLAYGIWASASGGAVDSWAGWFQGKVKITQLLTVGAIDYPSDQMFKTGVADLGNAMSLISQLQPRTYYYDTVNYQEFNFDNSEQMGLIAQEVETVIPNIVSEHVSPAQYDTLGNLLSPQYNYKGIEYTELIPLLIAGMQEQQAELNSKDSIISSLNDRLTQIESCLAGLGLCQTNARGVESTPEDLQNELRSSMEVVLSDKDNIVLNQNVPNPFAERTTISWSLPETVGKAQIHFYNGMGQLIQSVEIKERGNGQLNVFAADLSTGVYTYSLVADGIIVATKRMVKQ